MNPACNERQPGDAVVQRAGEAVVQRAGGAAVQRAGEAVPRAGGCDRPDPTAPRRFFRRCDQADPHEGAAVDCCSMTDVCERKKKCCVPPPIVATNTCSPPPPPPQPPTQPTRPTQPPPQQPTQPTPQQTPGCELGSQPPAAPAQRTPPLCSGARYRLPGNRNFCHRNTDAKGCCNFDLTEYGREFVLRTGKSTRKCLCIKFNGLQDYCQHPSCFVKTGCLISPYPTCPPAQQWKCDVVCKDSTPSGC